MKPHPLRRSLRALAAAGFAAGLAACATPGVVPEHPAALTTGALGVTTSAAETAAAADPLAADWYRQFDDAALNALIERALAGSPTLAAAAARADRAAALAGIARSGLYPQVNAAVSSTRQRYTEHGLVPPAFAGATRTINDATVSGSWELDLFGLHRAQLDAAIGAAHAAAVDAQAARILLTTRIARGWYALARLLAQQRTLEAIRGQRQQTVGLVQNRVRAGLDTNVELRQAQTQALEVDRDLAMLDEQITLARHALAALSGQGPDALAGAAPDWEAARTLALPAALPVDLLGRRADLTAARLRVEAGLRDVAAAQAQFYPNISLTAFVGLNAIGFPDWLDGGSRTYGAGPAIRLPILDAGRLRANLRARSADVDGAIAAYNGALIDAVRDAADQLTTLQSLQTQQQRQADVQRTADQAESLATARYRAGLGNFLTVLQAQTNVLAQRRVTVDLKYRVVDAQIALVSALGGGWRGEAAVAAR
ncbi:MAG: efflux transporter outer membrane subunit [Lautropia sp.]